MCGCEGGGWMHTAPTHPHITRFVDPCASVEGLVPGTMELRNSLYGMELLKSLYGLVPEVYVGSCQEQWSCLTVYMENKDSKVHEASKKLRA